MQGRLENEIKISNKTNKLLSDAPDFLTDWYSNLVASGKTASTCSDYISKAHKFLCFINKDINKVKANDITESIIDAYFNSIRYKKEGNESVETSGSLRLTTWYALNCFCDFLSKRKYIPTNYVLQNIARPKNNDLARINANRQLLTKEDFQSILQYAESSCQNRFDRMGLEVRDYAILMTLMSTGMRKTALISINVDDIDLKNNKLTVVDKGNSFIQYTLSNKLKAALLDWIEERKEWVPGKETALFVSTNGKRIATTTLDKLVDKYCYGALGYHISPHKLRSGFVTIMINETGNIALASKMVGHKNISTTQRYYATAGKEMEQAASIIDDIL